MRSKTAATAALALAMLLAPAPATGQMTTTPNDRIFVVYVNIGWNSDLGSDYDGIDFFRRIADPELKPNESDASPNTYKPDIVLANEVPHADPNGQRDKYGFRNKLEEYVGGQWGFVHSEHPDSTTAVYFRRDRFELVGSHSWAELTGANCDGPGPKGNNEIVAKLRPFHKDAAVIASAVHFEAGASTGCLGKNLARANSTIEGMWSVRPITVLAGDFNERPEPADDNPDTGNREWRIEDSPWCWWRDFNADDNCSAPAGWYYDTVRGKNWAPDTPGDICSEWTRENSYRSSNEQADQCESDKVRIDYIWARWENSSGAPQTTGGRIEGATADRGYWNDPNTADSEDAQHHRYSDHRAVRTVLRLTQ